MPKVLSFNGKLLVVVCCVCAVLFFAGTVMAATTGTETEEPLAGFEKLLKEAMDELMAKFDEIDADESLTTEEKKQALMDWADVQRYGEDQDVYFQFFELDGTMILDPYSFLDIGKNFLFYRDNDETYVFQEMKRIADKSGFLDYMWPKPDGAAQVSKKSFISRLAAWGWICAVGKYLETVEPYDLEVTPAELDDIPDETPDPSGV